MYDPSGSAPAATPAALPPRFKLRVAAHLFLRRGDAILLSLRANTGYADGQYSVVAGHLDGGEEVVAAMIREAREEAGITLRPDDVHVVGVMHRHDAAGNDESVDFFLTATRWTGDIINAEPDRCADLSWHDLDALPPNMVPYVRAAIAHYRAGRWYAGHGWETPPAPTPITSDC